MSAAGIIAEYNPFHNGHCYHIEETRRLTGADEIVVVMSGDFVQRGEPAITNKWKRAEWAVRGGADLVIELPVVYSCGSAELFAFGAVKLMCRMGVVDYLSFGAENGSCEKLCRAAEFFLHESDDYRNCLKKYLSEGISYAAARTKAAEDSGMPEARELLNKPNNILAVEYLKCLIREESSLKKSGPEKDGASFCGSESGKLPKPVAVKRKSAGYYEADPREKIAGGGELRRMLRESLSIRDYIPDSVSGEENYDCEYMDGNKICFPERMYELLVYKLISEKSENLNRIDGVFEGLENRAKRAALEAVDYESLVNMIKSKRYSRTSVQRMLLRILLGIEKKDVKEFAKNEAVYARVLGFTEKGAALIRRIKKTGGDRIQMITNINRESLTDETLKKMLETDVRASEIYELLSTGRAGDNSDHRIRPYHMK